MGIYSIKDIDIAVNHIYDDTIETSISALIPAGTVIAINSIENSIIQKDVLYRVENGSFNELNLWKFCISGDKIYYTSAGTESSVTVATFNDGVLTASTDVYLAALDNMVVQEYSYKDESTV
jgi:hypothetical protein